MNGALTMQIIDAATPTTDIELNVAGDPAMGWKVRKRRKPVSSLSTRCSGMRRTTRVTAIRV
jgi:hypothetical protein